MQIYRNTMIRIIIMYINTSKFVSIPTYLPLDKCLFDNYIRNIFVYIYR